MTKAIAWKMAPWTAVSLAWLTVTVLQQEPVTTLVGAILISVGVHLAVWWEARNSASQSAVDVPASLVLLELKAEPQEAAEPSFRR